MNRVHSYWGDFFHVALKDGLNNHAHFLPEYLAEQPENVLSEQSRFLVGWWK